MTESRVMNFSAHARLKDIVGRGLIISDDIGEPNNKTRYGFSGDIKPISIPALNGFETTQHRYYGLEYDRLENDKHYFKLPEEHPGHEWFEGCSGAPIIGDDGKVVSLVSDLGAR
jgi:hypothetical protein